MTSAFKLAPACISEMICSAYVLIHRIGLSVSTAEGHVIYISLLLILWCIDDANGMHVISMVALDEVGFRAMLDAVQERTKGHTIFLFLSKPIALP